ncbi:hypothetical protein AAFF_G00181570 [Aldrovandia affinis]|uniref:PDZ domain-containing protein n=1 Tax=Aldrovandia affinis TaxID=143900 RepID=A0AAD7SYF9_9TELE|nr:hypothetical protein AAFF_G00181570 [Aldrovandia affinis]
MGTGDYLCITVRGGAPWGFSLLQGNELHHPLLVSQVASGGRGALAGLCEGDEVVSLNGEPCADLTLPESIDLMEASTDSLQLLVKRCGVPQPLCPDSERAYFGEAESVEEGLESTTLEIWPSGGSPAQGELYILESQNEACYGETESDTDLTRGARTTLETPCRGHTLGSFAPRTVVELQVSLSDHSLEETSTSGGGGAAVVTVAPRRDNSQDQDFGGSKAELAKSLYIAGAGREPHNQWGDLVTSSFSSLGQVEVTLQCPQTGWQKEEEEEGGASGSVDSQEEGGPTEAPPACVSFGISAEGAEPAEESDSETERDLGRPNKHRARHARLRRSDSQSEKQVKEAKSKCKRIALLLTAAPNSNNKGVLMFKRHRQRAKKYTLISYGTGENKPEDEEEEYEEGEEDQAVEFTLLATSKSELDEDFFVNAQGRGDIVTYDWDTGLLEIEKKLDSQEEMERLPETKGKGVLMFAQRRQRIDEITAEHEEMRRKGLPVEGLPETENVPVTKSHQVEEGFCMQSTVKHAGQAYMDSRGAANSMVSRQMNSYTHAPKTPPIAMGEVSSAGGSEKPALRGRGAELFARRQARMEKYVVDSETVQANKVKSSSPTPSLPVSWKYSPNVRAPPPLSYNPILSPFYPPAAMKQPPQVNPTAKAKSKAKATPAPKHLNVLDVMKHQPYQLDPSLFTYGSTIEAKSPSPKPAPTPDSGLAYSPSPVPAPTPTYAPTLAHGISKVKPTEPVSVPYPFARQQPLSPAVHDGPFRQALANPHPQPPSTYAIPTFPLPPKAESVTGVPSAPRPKFSAKKPAMASKAWKPVVMGQ